MRANLWKDSFNGGELSPRLCARIDQVKYGSGASVMQNFIPTAQGPIIRRGGAPFVAPVRKSSDRTWLLRFKFNTVNSYTLEFGDKYIRFFTNRGIVSDISAMATAMSNALPGVITATNSFASGDSVQASGFTGALGNRLNGQTYTIHNPTGSNFQLIDIFGIVLDTTSFPAYSGGGTFSRFYQIASPYSVADLTDNSGRLVLTFFQSQSVIYIAHPKYPLQILSRLGNSDWTIARAALKNGPFQATNNVQAQTVYVTPTSTSVSGAVGGASVSTSITGYSIVTPNGQIQWTDQFNQTQTVSAFLIRLAVTSTASFSNGQTVNITGATGTYGPGGGIAPGGGGPTGAASINGTFTATVIDGTHLELQGTQATAYQIGRMSGGSAAVLAGAITLTVGSTTGLSNGTTVEVYGVTGSPEANGIWTISVVDATHIILTSSNLVNPYTSGGTVLGRDGTAISITANSPIFQSVGADELFFIQSPITSNLPQWEPAISITAGQRYQSGLNTYIALNSATSGSNTPVHTQGAVFDGAGSGGVQWLYEDSGSGVIALNAITSSSTATGLIQIAPPNANTSSTNQSYRWAHGIFGSVQGYPSIVTIFRDRLTLFFGIQAMGSVSDDYLNFSPLIGGQQTADSGYVITLPIASAPQWATSQNDLLVGTQDVELIITEINPSNALGPTNIRSRLQTSHGSVRCDAVPVEFYNMFVNKSGQQLRQQVYSWMVTGYIANDMTMFGEHLPKGPDGKQGIVQMAWCQDPDYLLWANTTDGRLICFSFHSEQQVTAWHNHPIGGSDAQAPLAAKGFTNAVVESIASIPSPDGTCDDLWMIVKRTINGQELRFIEYITQYFTDVQANIANAFYIDSGLTYVGATSQTIFGFDHLKGQTLDVLVNGAPDIQSVVAADGSITLSYVPAGTTMTVQAGLPCWARFVSMRPEGGTQMGTAQTLLKQVSQIALRMLSTLGIKFGDPYGPGGESAYEAVEFRTPQDPMDAPPPLYTGDKGKPGENDMNFGSATDTDAFIGILCDQPLPCTIAGLRATMEVTE